MKQGEIWLINLDPVVGAEIKKTRPAVIVNHNSLGKLPLRIIVPLTEWKDQFSKAPWMVKIEPDNKNGITKTSSLDCFQIRSVYEDRFIKKIGDITQPVSDQLKISLARVLSIEI